jgi:hypothetical protein
MRANALRAPTEGFKVCPGSFDALEMGSIEMGVLQRGLGCGHDLFSGRVLFVI